MHSWGDSRTKSEPGKTARSRGLVGEVSVFGQLGNPHEIDAIVRARLATSLAHVVERAGKHVSISGDKIDAALQRIIKHKQDPGLFARYYDLIFSITANELAKANSLLAEIVRRSECEVSFSFAPFDRETLGSDYERFPRLLFSDFSSTEPMGSPTKEQAAAATKRLQKALRVIAVVDRSIYDEIVALLARVYIAVDGPSPSAERFAGVTSFLVWGGSFINIDNYKTEWDSVQFLVHEVTHALLFALSVDEPLVKNSPDESYKSPLRTDPRPMDGIFHATMVCARLSEFNQAWLKSGLVKDFDQKKTEMEVQRRKQQFEDGIAVIKMSGKLSDQGRDLLKKCRNAFAVHA